jgi:hypothetical protein
MEARMQHSADNGEKRLLRERAKLADFGLLAVEGADLDELLQEAAAEAARSLDVSFVKVRIPDRGEVPSGSGGRRLGQRRGRRSAHRR